MKSNMELWIKAVMELEALISIADVRKFYDAPEYFLRYTSFTNSHLADIAAARTVNLRIQRTQARHRDVLCEHIELRDAIPYICLWLKHGDDEDFGCNLYCSLLPVNIGCVCSGDNGRKCACRKGKLREEAHRGGDVRDPDSSAFNTRSYTT